MKHIYIIEDDVGILEGLTFLLEKSYKVTAIVDARTALNKLESEQPDLILLDLLMPEFNGTAFLEAFSNRSLKIPILVMSACSTVNIQNYSAVAGLIRKPFQIEEIVTRIEQILAS